jgi:hypothetical protein
MSSLRGVKFNYKKVHFSLDKYSKEISADSYRVLGKGIKTSSQQGKDPPN